MNTQDHSDHYSNWKPILDLQSSTQNQINITSYGDWVIAIYQRDANKVDRPIHEIVKENKMQWYMSDEDKDLQYVVQNYSHLKNIKQAFQKLTVNINISQEEFRNIYGFWQINDFTVYNRNGNSCTFSFRANDKVYLGSYGTTS